MIGEHGENLVFLLGVPRSGTTLLGAMLSNHPDVLCPQEPWVMLALHALGKTNPHHPADAQLLGEATRQFLDHDVFCDAARRGAVAAYNRKLSDSGRTVFVDKTPRYHLILSFIDELFPKAKYIWLKRDPFDVASSYKASWGVDLPKLIASNSGTPFEHDLVLGRNVLRESSKALRGKVKLSTARTTEIVDFVVGEAAQVVEKVDPAEAKVDADDALVLGEAIAGQAEIFVTGDCCSAWTGQR